MHPEHHLLHFAPSVHTPTRCRWVKTVGRRLRRKSGLPPHPSGLPPPCYLHTGWPSAHTRVPAELGLEVATGAGWRSTKGGLAHGRMWNALVSPLSEKQNAAYFCGGLHSVWGFKVVRGVACPCLLLLVWSHTLDRSKGRRIHGSAESHSHLCKQSS